MANHAARAGLIRKGHTAHSLQAPLRRASPARGRIASLGTRSVAGPRRSEEAQAFSLRKAETSPLQSVLQAGKRPCGSLCTRLGARAWDADRLFTGGGRHADLYNGCAFYGFICAMSRAIILQTITRQFFWRPRRGFGYMPSVSVSALSMSQRTGAGSLFFQLPS